MHLPRVRFTIWWMMSAVGLVAIMLTPIAAWLESRRLRTGSPLVQVTVLCQPAEAKLSTQEAIRIAESTCRANGANPPPVGIASAHSVTGGLWCIRFESIPPSPGGPLILIDDVTKESLVIPGE